MAMPKATFIKWLGLGCFGTISGGAVGAISAPILFIVGFIWTQGDAEVGPLTIPILVVFAAVLGAIIGAIAGGGLAMIIGAIAKVMIRRRAMTREDAEAATEPSI